MGVKLLIKEEMNNEVSKNVYKIKFTHVETAHTLNWQYITSDIGILKL